MTQVRQNPEPACNCWQYGGASPCLFGHLVLVSPGQLIQVGLQNGLHFIMVGRAEGGRWWLAVGHCGGRWSSPPQGRSGTPLLLLVMVQVLVTVRLNGHGRGPAVAVISETHTQILLILTSHKNIAALMMSWGKVTNYQGIAKHRAWCHSCI